MGQLRLFSEREVVEVLVIDRDPTVADLLRRRLKRAVSRDFRVVEAASAPEAVATFGEHRPDVVVLGVSADDLGGLDSLSVLRGAAATVPVVVLHHSRDIEAGLEAVVTGAADVLPLHEARGVRLERVLRSAIARRTADADAFSTAFTDPVTGLGNRHWLTDRLERAVAHATGAGPDWQLAVLFADLDRFKLVNDTLGHAKGDELLRMVADRLRRAVRADDVIARYGGDEFAIVLEGHRVEGLAHRVALRAQAAFAEPFGIDGHAFSVFTSIGLAVHRPGESAATLLEHADTACYRAKRRGRNRVVVFDDALRAWTHHRHDTDVAFARALEADELHLDLRPVLDLRRGGHDHRVGGFVAEASWPYSPEDESAVDVAVRAGLGPTLGQWLLRRVVLAVRVGPGQRALVALPPGLVQQPAFPSWLDGELGAAGFDPARLVLLVDEVEFAEPELMLPAAEALGALGVGLALDGFGTGTSSLTLFASAMVDEVRLARSVCARVADDRTARDYVAGLALMARSVGQHLVATGVGDAEALDVLADLGVHSVECDAGLATGGTTRVIDLAPLAGHPAGGPGTVDLASSRPRVGS